MADLNASLLQWLNGPGPQYKIKDQLKMEAVEGSNGAPFSQIVDKNGVPFDSVNRMQVDAQLTGSNVEDTLLNAEAVLDTSERIIDMDMSNFSWFDFWVINTLDQPVRIGFKDAISNVAFNLMLSDGTTLPYQTYPGQACHHIPPDTQSIVLSQTLIYNSDGTKTDVVSPSPFKDYFVKNLRMVARCNVAPTSGTLTIKRRGRWV